MPQDRRAERLSALFALTVGEVGLPFGQAWVARAPEPGGSVAGGVVVLRPDRPVPAHVWQRVAAAEAEVLGERRRVSEQADAACAGLRPSEPHLIVATMGVRPDHRRRGVARALLEQALALADQLGVPAYLETSSTANVALYQRSGFGVSGHLHVPGGGPPVWAMRREAPG
ncbi:GNAT family N-acetyltransferase [Ornithinimicrobium avium]|uniref:GNAT family N-acetyltransferase n=1 Tax=Ornithinimicrobium avium TaxID=2283195 RepID=UPI00192D3AC2|nr:GNAT family N-acetyltransferase [Ornithinimicrobium avium]